MLKVDRPTPPRVRSAAFLAFALALAFAASAHATVFYVDPATGSMANDGSSEHPWSTLEEVFAQNKIESRAPATHPHTVGGALVPKNAGAPVKAGDTLRLRTGYHGRIEVAEYYNSDTITIEAQEGHAPRLANIELRSVSKWILRGLTVSPSFAAAFETKTLVQFASHSWTGPSFDCRLERSTLYSAWDTSAWTSDDWNTKSCNGISLPGDDMVASANHLKNTNFGITVTGKRCLVEHNTVENFSGDGMRGLGDYAVFEHNTVKNLYLVNSNHPDGFQSWSVGADGSVGTGVVTGIVLRGNMFINYEDPNQPFRASLQGIGCFDGMFADWVVENNVILTDHWHGISLYGAQRCRVINNTVVDLNAVSPGPPWIMITAHKNGTASSDCVVRNNLATDFSVSGTGIVQDHNIESRDYAAFFVDYARRDLHLKAGAPAIDAGSSELAPSVDRDGRSRPSGSGVDVGAYEYSAQPREPHRLRLEKR